MSLGWNTESALLPSKAKAIDVSQSSMLDLKAIVFEREEQRRHARRHRGAEAVRRPQQSLGAHTTNTRAQVVFLFIKERKKES